MPTKIGSAWILAIALFLPGCCSDWELIPKIEVDCEADRFSLQAYWGRPFQPRLNETLQLSQHGEAASELGSFRLAFGNSVFHDVDYLKSTPTLSLPDGSRMRVPNSLVGWTDGLPQAPGHFEVLRAYLDTLHERWVGVALALPPQVYVPPLGRLPAGREFWQIYERGAFGEPALFIQAHGPRSPRYPLPPGDPLPPVPSELVVIAVFADRDSLCGDRRGFGKKAYFPEKVGYSDPSPLGPAITERTGFPGASSDSG